MSIQDNIRTAVRNRLFKADYDQLQEIIALTDVIYREGKYTAQNAQTINSLKESTAYADLVQRLQLDEFDLFNQNAFAYDRIKAIQYARYMSSTDQNVQNANEMWTDFALGQGISVTSEQYPIVEITFGAAQNEHLFASENIHEISTSALNEGEQAFAYWFNPITVNETGVSVRSIPTDQIEPIWLDDDDKTRAVWYKRNLQDGTAVYYPDWQATPEELALKAPPENAKRTDQMSGIDGRNTIVTIDDEQRETLVAVMSWSRMNRLAGGRGLPRFRTAFEWATVLTNFMGDRAAVARKAAMYTDNVTVTGGSRAVRDVVNALQSSLANAQTTRQIYDKNPPPVAGSDWVQNEQIAREWQTRNTDAANAFQDGQMLAGQLGLTTGVALHWAGFPGAIPGGLATARELLKPWMAKIERYQLWLTGLFRNISLVSVNIGADLVLSSQKRIAANETDIAVSLLSPIMTDVNQLLDTMKTVNTSMKDGTLDPAMGSLAQEIALVLTMTKLGVPDYEAKLQELADQTAVADESPFDDETAVGVEPEPEVDTETLELLRQIGEQYNAGNVSPESVALYVSKTFGNGRY